MEQAGCQGDDVEQDGDRALQGFQPAVERLLTLHQPQQTPHQHDGVDGDEDAGAFADHVTGVEGILQPPVFFHLAHVRLTFALSVVHGLTPGLNPA